MFMLGTIVNAAAVALCAGVGSFMKKGIPERVRTTMLSGVALCVVFIGISGALGGYADFIGGGNALFADYGLLFIIFSVALGGLLGELLRIDGAINRLGAFAERKLAQRHPQTGSGSVSAGFVNCTILFCVGSMAILGAMQDTGTGTPEILFSKAVLDGITALVMATTLGIGCALSALPILLYEGGIALLSVLFLSDLPGTVMGALTCSGSLVIVAIGLNMLELTKIRTANFIPAVFLPLLLLLFA